MYTDFIRRFARSLSQAQLPAAPLWIASQPEGLGIQSRPRVAGDIIVMRAFKFLSNPEIQIAAAAVIATRLRYTSRFIDFDDRDEDEPLRLSAEPVAMFV
jgi:hypothetical protein